MDKNGLCMDKNQLRLFPTRRLAFFALLKPRALLQQSLPTQSYQDHFPALLVSHEEPCLFRALKIKSFALALPWQSLPSQSYQDHLPASLVSQPSLAFFAPSESWALLQQSLPYIGKLSTRKAYHEYLPTFRALRIVGFAPAKPPLHRQSLPSQSLPQNASHHGQAPQHKQVFQRQASPFFAPSKSWALPQQSLPYIGKLSTCKAYHEYLPTFRALKIVGFASAKPSTERLPSFACFPRGSLAFFAPSKSMALLQQSPPRRNLPTANLSLVSSLQQSLPTQSYQDHLPALLVSHVEASPFSRP